MKSYSTEGQDSILVKILNCMRNGRYLDVGAYQPILDSNTYALYQKEWSGVAIDPNPGLSELWKRTRKRDMFLNAAYSVENGPVEYHQHPNLSTLNSVAAPPLRSKGFEVTVEQIKTILVPTISYKQLLSLQPFDLMCLDTEGGELEILKNVLTFLNRPKCICVETKNLNLSRPLDHPIFAFLNDANYAAIAKTLHDTIFVDRESFLSEKFPKEMLEFKG